MVEGGVRGCYFFLSFLCGLLRSDWALAWELIMRPLGLWIISLMRESLKPPLISS